MKTLQTPLIINEILNSAQDKCADSIKVLDKVKQELDYITTIGLVDLDYSTLDANIVLDINEQLFSLEEDLYELLLKIKNMYRYQKEEMIVFGKIGYA